MDKNTFDHSKVGLVLSGGGVRGMAHIGLIKAMETFGIQAHSISGSSAGALVGALYAQGHTVTDMLRFFKETPLFKYNFFALGKPGLIDTVRYTDLFKEHFPEDSFQAMEKPLFVVATNLESGEEVVISEGELIRPLLASAALPPVFSPVMYRGRLHADGGIMNNFPIEPLLGKGLLILGCNVSVLAQADKKNLTNSLQLTSRTTALMVHAINRRKVEKCDILVAPEALGKVGILDRKGIEKAYAMGYETAVREFERLGIGS